MKKLPYLYKKIIEKIPNGRATHRKDLNSAAANFRLTKKDIVNVCKEFESYGFLKRQSRDKWKINW